MMYIDDQLVSGKDEKECAANNKFSLETFGKAGWVVSPEKSTGPSSRLTFLGLDVCSTTSKFYIPEKKFSSLCHLLEEAFFAPRLQPRWLASLVGKLQSCSRAVGPVVRLMTRAMYRFICSTVDAFSWSYFARVPEEVKEEVLFWWRNLSGLNGFSFSRSVGSCH